MSAVCVGGWAGVIVNPAQPGPGGGLCRRLRSSAFGTTRHYAYKGFSSAINEEKPPPPPAGALPPPPTLNTYVDPYNGDVDPYIEAL